MDFVHYGSGTQNGYLDILTKQYFYDDSSLQASVYTYLTCFVQPTHDLQAGPTMYAYQVSHSATGISNPVSFYIDDSEIPVVNSIDIDISSMQQQVISGVPVLNAGLGRLNVSVSNVISSFYNCKYGLAVLKSDAFPDQNENTLRGRNVGGYVSGSSQTISFDFDLKLKQYCEDVSFEITAYNAIDQTASGTIISSLHYDCLSRPNPAQVTSGFGLYPDIRGLDFGNAYDDTISLLTTNELQLTSGKYGVPMQTDYSPLNPPGPDYSQVRTKYPFRYATFSFEMNACCSNLVIVIEDIEGSGWGSSKLVAENTSLQVRVMDESTEQQIIDSGWLDANRYYDATGDTCHGSACLLTSGTTDCLKHITFGRMRRGSLFVRIGFEALADLDQKRFRNIRIEQCDFLKRTLVCDMANKILKIEDCLFQAYVAGTADIVDNICGTPPTFEIIRNFYDGNHGTVECLLSRDGKESIRGMIDMQMIGACYNDIASSSDIRISNKFDVFAKDPNKSGLMWAATLSLKPTGLSASNGEFAYQIKTFKNRINEHLSLPVGQSGRARI